MRAVLFLVAVLLATMLLIIAGFAGGYEVWMDGDWNAVPDIALLRHQANPTGHGVLCRSPFGGAILCFVPASEG
jgi:hypothetical protein